MFWGQEILTLSVLGAVHIEPRGEKCVDPRLGGVALVCRNGATSFVLFLVVACVAQRGPTWPYTTRHLRAHVPLLSPFPIPASGLSSSSWLIRGIHTSPVHGCFDAGFDALTLIGY